MINARILHLHDIVTKNTNSQATLLQTVERKRSQVRPSAAPFWSKFRKLREM